MNDYTIENHVIGIQRFRIGKRTILVGRRLYHLPDFAQSAPKPALKFAHQYVPFFIQDRHPSA
jgi:hypothetical protein